jgi:hypothetical protein
MIRDQNDCIAIMLLDSILLSLLLPRRLTRTPLAFGLVRRPVRHLALLDTVEDDEAARNFLSPAPLQPGFAQCVRASRYAVCSAGAPIAFETTAAVPSRACDAWEFAPC